MRDMNKKVRSEHGDRQHVSKPNTLSDRLLAGIGKLVNNALLSWAQGILVRERWSVQEKVLSFDPAVN